MASGFSLHMEVPLRIGAMYRSVLDTRPIERASIGTTIERKRCRARTSSSTRGLPYRPLRRRSDLGSQVLKLGSLIYEEVAVKNYSLRWIFAPKPKLPAPIEGTENLAARDIPEALAYCKKRLASRYQRDPEDFEIVAAEFLADDPPPRTDPA